MSLSIELSGVDGAVEDDVRERNMDDEERSIEEMFGPDIWPLPFPADGPCANAPDKSSWGSSNRPTPLPRPRPRPRPLPLSEGLLKLNCVCYVNFFLEY